MADVKKDLAKATAGKLSGAEAETVEDSSTMVLEVEVRGTKVELTVPASFEDADPDVLLNMECDRPMSAFRELIGEAQWRRLKSLGWNARAFREVVETWQERAGLGNA